ncbi:unnamed protein product, partial [Brassica rapa subsp. narinosa]
GSSWSTRPYLDSVRKQSYLRGCNSAAAGSTIQKENAAPISLFVFGVQVSQFITFDPIDTYQRNIFFKKMDCLCLMSDKMNLPVHFSTRH